MPKTNPPFRADHVGSILRSAPLKEARAKREKGEITPAQLKAVEDTEIKKIIAKQEEIVRPELRASLASDLGDRLTTVELDCGHMVYWDAFGETVAALRAFLGP